MPSTTYLALESIQGFLDPQEYEAAYSEALSQAMKDILGGDRASTVLILPPDGTRLHSGAGRLTDLAVSRIGPRLAGIMPALGTHLPMSSEEIKRMFPGSPLDKFLVHDWRNDVVELGRIEGAFLARASQGAVDYDWPAQVNKALLSPGLGMVISIGQVVPHEVAGMANHAKNLFVGAGGKEGIDKSHFAGAAFGMERVMGRLDNPVRALFDEALARWGSSMPPVLWALTVVAATPGGGVGLKGLYLGTGRDCLERAAAMARRANITELPRPIRKAVAYLDPTEYRSTWLGNKAIYRTRMAMADEGELLVLAPGLETFGEDKGIDALIRRYGYRGRETTLAAVKERPDLAASLSAAAHLMHGSTDGRFSVRYCPGRGVSRAEIESVGFKWGDLDEALSLYDPARLSTGYNAIGGEEIFFIPNPALGLWSVEGRL